MSITINTTVWDFPENWDSAFSNNVYFPPFPADSGHISDFPYGANSIWSGYANGNLDTENFDDTICPWAYGKNAPFLGGMWWIPNNDGTADLSPAHMRPETIEFKMSSIVNRQAFPAIFGRNSDWQFSRPFVQKYREITDNVENVSTWIDNAGFGRIFGSYAFKPATNFNYNKICCCPRIMYLSQIDGSDKTKSDIDSLFSGEIGNKYYQLPYSDSIVTIDSCTLWQADGNSRETLNNHYIVGISFDFYIVDSNTSNPNYNSDFGFGVIENEPFPPLADSGSFGDNYRHPFNLLGGGPTATQDHKITIGGFTFFGMGSAVDQLYSKNDWINSAYRNSNGQYNPQPKLFLGVNSSKWTYYGYTAFRLYNQLQQAAPFWVWNGTVDEIINYTKRTAAYIGFPIITRANSETTNKKTGWNGTGENELLPVFDENGYTTGDYVTGAAAAEQPNATWGTEVWEKTEYKGTPPGDPNEYDTHNKTELNLQDTQMMMRFCKGYLLTKTQVDQLAVACYDIGSIIGSAPDIVQEMLTKLFLKDGDPMDMIISLMFFPFNPAKYFVNVPQSEEIFFGAYPTGITAKRWDNLIVEIDMGSCTFYPTMGDSIDDFRNYQPYTTAELQLPYIGSVDIDPHIYLGHKISVKYVVDLCTGSCQALIYRDSLVVDQLSGHIGSAVSVKGVDQLEQLTAQQRAQANLKQARNTQISNIARMGITAAAAVGSVLTGGTLGVALGAGAIGGASNLIHSQNSTEQAEYEVDHIQTPYREIGHASSITAYRGEQFCRLIIKRPRMDATFSEESYAHSTGYATLRTAALSQFSGYTVCSSADLSGITATDQELNAIAAALRAGVYL